MSARDPNTKTTGGGGGGCCLHSANSTSVCVCRGGGGCCPLSADSTSGKAHFRSIEKVDGYCPDQLAFNKMIHIIIFLMVMGDLQSRGSEGGGGGGSFDGMSHKLQK